MTNRELIIQLMQMDMDLPVRIDDINPDHYDGSINLWVYNAVEHKTGESGHEIEGEITLWVRE